jgi:hypothetical protein
MTLIFKWIKKGPLGAVGSCCRLVGPGPEFLIDIPDHIRREIMEMKQDNCAVFMLLQEGKLCRNTSRQLCIDEQW